MHEPIGTYRCEISIFAQGCVTVTVQATGQGQRLDDHVHCGPFPDYEGLAHAVRDHFALWVAGGSTEDLAARLSAL